MAADGARLLKRLEQLKGRRGVVEGKWREAFNLTHPLRGAGLEAPGALTGDAGTASHASAQSRQAELLDTTGTDGSRILASALQSGLTPANSRWPGLEVGDENDEERRWLDESAEAMWENIHASNYDSVAFDCMLDMSIAGMFPMFVDEAPGGGYQFEEWALANSYFAASKPGGAIDTVFNEYPLSAEQAVNDYGDRVSDKTRELAAARPDEQIQFVRCVYPRSGVPGRFALNLPFASVHLEKDSKQVVRESGYHEQPIGVPRWQMVAGSVYAEGPAVQALPDLKTLNTEVGYVLANADLAIAGMWGAVDDGVLNPRTVRVGPRKIIVMAEKDNMWPLQPATKFDIAVLEIERLQRSIRKMFMADQLEPQQRPGQPPTATEVMVRVELIRQLLGPVYGRLQAEYLQWLVTRCFGIAYRAGIFAPAPRSILTRSIAVTYHSPIARAQKAVDVAAMDRYEQTLTNEALTTGKSELLDNYDWDEAARKRAELLGVPAKLIPERDDVEKLRAGRAQAQQQATAMDLVASVVRDNKGNISGLSKPRAAA